jgi:hypothetical protein
MRGLDALFGLARLMAQPRIACVTRGQAYLLFDGMAAFVEGPARWGRQAEPVGSLGLAAVFPHVYWDAPGQLPDRRPVGLPLVSSPGFPPWGHR